MPLITETFTPADRKAWRAWLEQHHASKKEIWLVLFKKRTGKAAVTLEDAVEEALCFGWIDGQLRRIDDEKHALRFSPRKANSVWAESNKARIAKLIAAGKMTPAGLASVAAAKESGEWDKATEREDVDTLPADLDEALAQHPGARENFARMAPSHRKQYLYWVNDAKRDETRQRRIAEVVKLAEKRRRPGAGE